MESKYVFSDAYLKTWKMKTENKNPLSLINSEIKRPAEIPKKGMLSDLLWADPDTDKNNKD